MSELGEFLTRYPPFSHLTPDALADVEQCARVIGYDAEVVVLREDGPPAREIYVVRTGSVELAHDDDVVDVLEPGEVFGHPSMLSGRAPAFTVRTREPTQLVVIPAPVATRVLPSEFVASTLRERMVRAGHVSHAQADVRTAHLGDLVHRPAAICLPDTTVREAAAEMARKDVSCILVETPSGYGVLTDSDLRRRLVAQGLPYETPVSELMVPRALTVPADMLAVDAMIDMLDAGIHHLPVVDSRGVPIGIVTATDLMYLESRTPFALRRSISKATEPGEVIEAARYLPQTVVALIRAGVSAVDLGRVLALATDTAVTRLMELAVAEEGEAPVPWAWMALGSVARREQALTSDQDNAMAYASPADPEVDAYFEAVATRVNDQLTACGFGPDNAGVLARNREWRMSADEWTNVFEVCLEQPDHSHLIRAAVSFDFRSVVGALDIVAPLVAVERRAPAYHGFLRRLARTATDFPTPLGRRNRISTDRDGAFDIKKQGVVPIANLARFHSLSVGGTVSPTLDRLATAAQGGAIAEGTHAALAEAFELVVRMRLEHQAEQVERGEVPDDRIHPDRLTPLTRGQLVQAFQVVSAEQKQLGRFVPLGI